MQLILSAKEIVCLAAALGISEVIGIADGFRDVPLRRLQREIDLTRESLEKKGVIESGLDGDSAINPSYRSMLETVLRSKRLVAIDAQLAGKGKIGVVYYAAAGQLVESVPGESGYTLCECSASECAERIFAYADWVAGPAALDCQPRLIKQTRLQALKGLQAGGKEAKEMENEGFSHVVIAMLFDAFSYQTNFYSYAFVDTADGGSLKTLMFIDDYRGALKLVPVVKNDENCILLESVPQKELQDELRARVQAFLL